MPISSVLNIIIGIALVAFICYRQMTWRPVNIAQMWRMPIILAIVGVVFLVQNFRGARFTSLDLLFLVIEVIMSLIVGAVMGRIAVFRPLPQPITTSSGFVATLQSRTGWAGLILWVALIGVRVGLDIFAASLGAGLITSTGLIILMVAANRVARTGVFAWRIDRHRVVTA